MVLATLPRISLAAGCWRRRCYHPLGRASRSGGSRPYWCTNHCRHYNWPSRGCSSRHNLHSFIHRPTISYLHPTWIMPIGGGCPLALAAAS
jgi:hypothetical protein